MKLEHPNPRPDPRDVFPNHNFMSVVVPTFNRPNYLRGLIESLTQYADMPYELIVCDDGSSKENQDQVWAMRDKISVIAFNTGLNAGLPTAANRAATLASSKYVLFLNDDCFFLRNTMKDVAHVLDKPYVGTVCVANDIGGLSPEEAAEAQGTRFAISSFLGGGFTMAFRKEVWAEVGGFDDRSPSGQADNVFAYKVFKSGYFKAVLEGSPRIHVHNQDKDYVDSFGLTKGVDCAYPKIFPHDELRARMMAGSHREACQYWVDGQRTIPDRKSFYDTRDNPVAGLNDIPYWGNYFQDMFGGKQSHKVKDINWEIAQRHGHAKWKDQILKDFEQCLR